MIDLLTRYSYSKQLFITARNDKEIDLTIEELVLSVIFYSVNVEIKRAKVL